MADVDSLREGLGEIECLRVLAMGLTNPDYALRFDLGRIRASSQIPDRTLDNASVKTSVPPLHFSFWAAQP